jgi:hypothetical protein
VKGFLVYDTRKSDFEKRNCMLVETADGIRVLRHGKLVKNLPDLMLDPYVILMRSKVEYVGGSGILVGSIVVGQSMHHGSRDVEGTVKFLEGKFVVDTGSECYDLWSEEYLWRFRGIDRDYINELRESMIAGSDSARVLRVPIQHYDAGKGVRGYNLNGMELTRESDGKLFYSIRKGKRLERLLCLHSDTDRVTLMVKGLPGVKVVAHVCCYCGEVKKYVEVTTEGVRDEVR